MEIKTKRYIEFSEEFIQYIKEAERFYNVEITISDGRRVDAYEAAQSHREAYRSTLFKDVKNSLKFMVNVRFWYYLNIVRISRVEAINRLSDCDFIRGKNTIEQYLMGGEAIRGDVDNLMDLDIKIPLFEWPKNKKQLPKLGLMTPAKDGKSRQILRERIISAYYYFYGSCLNYTDVDREYVICYRDFDISPKRLQRIVLDNNDYIEELQSNNVTPEQLREMYPYFAWNCSISFNDWDEIPDDCECVINTLGVY